MATTTRTRKAAPKAVEATATVTDEMQEEMGQEDYPLDCPTFRAFKSMSRRERANVMGNLSGISPDLFSRSDDDDAHIFKSVAGIFDAAACAEDFLLAVAIDPQAFEEWAEDVSDMQLINVMMTYIRKEKLGEPSGSSN